MRWHEAQEPGVGLALIDRAQEARNDIADWPHSGTVFAAVDDATVIRSKSRMSAARPVTGSNDCTTEQRLTTERGAPPPVGVGLPPRG